MPKPRKPRTCKAFFGSSTSNTSLTRSAVGPIPLFESSILRNTSLSVLKKHFSAFKVIPHSFRRSIVWWSHLLCVSVSGPCTAMSSEMFSTQSTPARARAIFFTEEQALVSKQTIGCSKGCDFPGFWAQSNWWYPHLRSNLLKTLEPFIVCNT